MDELKGQIQFARTNFRVEVYNWIKAQNGLTDVDKSHWKEVFKARDQEAMKRVIQQHALPILPISSLMDAPSMQEQPEPPQVHQIVQMLYQCSQVDTSAETTKLCQLTNAMQYLHHLSDLADKIDSTLDLRGLSLAFKMAKHINKQWRFVVDGRETVAFYSQRLEEAYGQYDVAVQSCDDNLLAYKDQIEARILQFQISLRHFANDLNHSYSLQEDNRNWLSRFLFAPYPWHKMLKGVASNLFGTENVTNPTNNSIQINEHFLEAISTQYAQLMRDPLNRLEGKVITLKEETQKQQALAKEKITAMNGTLDTMLQIHSKSRLSALLLPTRSLTMFGFFHGVLAAFGQQRFYSHLPAHGLTSEQSQSQSRDDQDGSDMEFRR